MSKSFFNYIQPTIVRLSNDESLPENLRGHYLVNLNVVGIPYFVDNYMLIEDGRGGYMYMLTNDAHKIRLSDTGLEGVIDVPRAYIIISKEFVESQDDFSSWILSSIADNSFFLTGTENFKPGVDFYINQVLVDYLQENEPEAFAQIPVGLRIALPNYLDGKFNITKYWTELDAELARYTNFDFFRLKNKIVGLYYTEEQLDSLCHTFFEVLYDGEHISEEDMLKLNNQIYDATINYYDNYQTDCALSNIALILNSTVRSQDNGVKNCGCQSSASDGSSNQNISCYDAYKQAMSQWLMKMLGDVDFYKDWMWMKDNEGNLYPNEGLIESLILLLENFEDAQYDLSFSGKSIYNHSCGDNYGSLINDENHKIIKNYIQVLKWVLAGCIDNNTNKIKVIGEKFGELLPKLCF